MLTVFQIHFPSEVAIVGCEITPNVLFMLPNGLLTTDDSLDGRYFISYRWYRIQCDQKVAVCSIHPTVPAILQCQGCRKSEVPEAESYHCSSQCFLDSWQHHRALHKWAMNAVFENEDKKEELEGRFGSGGTGDNSSLLGGAHNMHQSPGLNSGGEVGRSKTYTPTSSDIGHILKFECFATDVKTNIPVGIPNTILTSRVISAPSLLPRHLIPVGGVDVIAHVDSDGISSSYGSFTVLSYNILPDAYATNKCYSYCPLWALSWPYRRQNLLREIVGYGADILCLQRIFTTDCLPNTNPSPLFGLETSMQVQSDHFEDFFAPELDKHGYQAIYKKRTSEVYSGIHKANYGCATFFRKNRFAHVQKYEIEYNNSARSIVDYLNPDAQKKIALGRLIQDDVALIAVLEAKFNISGANPPGKRQRVCVANTHVNDHQALKDVKLVQVHDLLRRLEILASSTDIPMLVCGGFSSVPGSAPHSLLTIGKVDPMHPDLAVDPLGILQPATKINHHLTLVSAYSSFARMAGIGTTFSQQRRVDLTTNEPIFTHFTKEFIGTVDYIFYTADSLMVESLLELLDKESLRKGTALPSPQWSSDHLALLGKFRCCREM